MAAHENISTASKIPANMLGMGVAVAPDGTVWATDSQTAAPAVHTFTDAGEYDKTYKLPAGANPQSIALEVNPTQPKVVVAAWVADANTKLYRVQPSTTSPTTPGVAVDLTTSNITPDKLGGIAWDAINKRIWVVDTNRRRILAVNTESKSVDTQLTISNPFFDHLPQKIAVSKAGDVWFTVSSANRGGIGVRRATDGMIICGYVGGTDVRPDAIAVDDDSQTVWFVTQAENSLWRASSVIKSFSAPTAESDLSTGASGKTLLSTQVHNFFPVPISPFNIAVDIHGSVWIAADRAVYEMNQNGKPVQRYETAAKKRDVSSIAYSAVRDEMWIASKAGPQELWKLVPVDQVPPEEIITFSEKWKVYATPHKAAKVAGIPIDFELFVQKNINNVWTQIADHITLEVPIGSGAYFGSDVNQNSLSIITSADAGTKVTLNTLPTTPAGTINVNVTRRRAGNRIVFSANIAIAAKSVIFKDDIEEIVRLNQVFPTPVSVTISPPNASAKITIPSAMKSTFLDGTKETIVTGDPQSGDSILYVVRASDKGETFQLLADTAVGTPIANAKKSEKRIVTLEPTGMVVDPEDAADWALDSVMDKVISAKITANNGADPVQGAWVQFLIVPPDPKFDAAVFMTKKDAAAAPSPVKDGDTPSSYILIQTNDKGVAAIGGKTAKTYFYSSKEVSHLSIVVQVFDLSIRNNPKLVKRENIEVSIS
jgi:sugar lactone lactonase YvrE